MLAAENLRHEVLRWIGGAPPTVVGCSTPELLLVVPTKFEPPKIVFQTQTEDIPNSATNAGQPRRLPIWLMPPRKHALTCDGAALTGSIGVTECYPHRPPKNAVGATRLLRLTRRGLREVLPTAGYAQCGLSWQRRARRDRQGVLSSSKNNGALQAKTCRAKKLESHALSTLVAAVVNNLQTAIDEEYGEQLKHTEAKKNAKPPPPKPDTNTKTHPAGLHSRTRTPRTATSTSTPKAPILPLASPAPPRPERLHNQRGPTQR